MSCPLTLRNANAELFAGIKMSISFDEATIVGSDRYVTLNVHHARPILGKSRIAPLGMIRVSERASGSHLYEVISGRLETVGLSVSNIIAATTDGATNFKAAVGLMGIRQQKCLVHGLDLIVKKSI